MGTFCTTTSLSTLMQGTTFDSATTSLANKCITWSENDIRKQLSKRYDMSSATFQTSTSTPPLVTDIAEWLAMGFMYKVMSRGVAETMARGQAFIDMANSNLKALAEFQMDLLDSSGDPIATTTERPKAQSNTDGYHPTFDEDDPLNWSIDPDKVDDIADGRG